MAVLGGETTIEVAVFVLQTDHRSFLEHCRSAGLRRQWKTSWLPGIKLQTFSRGLIGEVSVINGGSRGDQLVAQKARETRRDPIPLVVLGSLSACRRRALGRACHSS